MKRSITLISTMAILVAGMMTVSSAMAGEILGVSVSPNPIVGLPKQFTINVTGTGYCDHLVVYWEISEGGITNKSSVWEKKNFNFNVLPQKQGTVSEKGDATVPGKKIVTAEPGPGAKNCGNKVATTTLNIYKKFPLINPQQQK